MEENLRARRAEREGCEGSTRAGLRACPPPLSRGLPSPLTPRVKRGIPSEGALPSELSLRPARARGRSPSSDTIHHPPPSTFFFFSSFFCFLLLRFFPSVHPNSSLFLFPSSSPLLPECRVLRGFFSVSKHPAQAKQGRLLGGTDHQDRAAFPEICPSSTSG